VASKVTRWVRYTLRDRLVLIDALMGEDQPAMAMHPLPEGVNADTVRMSVAVALNGRSKTYPLVEGVAFVLPHGSELLGAQITCAKCGTEDAPEVTVATCWADDAVITDAVVRKRPQ
jgi:hypothetical protein